MLFERGRSAVGVHEHPPTPLADACGDQRILGLVEPLEIAEPWSCAEGPIELVDPRVVGALDGAQVPRRARLEQLVPTVATGVVEASEHAVVAADGQGAFVPDPECALITGVRKLVGAAYADPPLLEQMRRFPVEDGL